MINNVQGFLLLHRDDWDYQQRDSDICGIAVHCTAF